MPTLVNPSGEPLDVHPSSRPIHPNSRSGAPPGAFPSLALPYPPRLPSTLTSPLTPHHPDSLKIAPHASHCPSVKL